MGSTLGFVAVVVGLGAIFGAILERSGGAEALATFMLSKFGEKHSSWALMITGFVVAIPVFFDVAFIILVPMIYALQRKTGKSLLLYGIPLLAGLAITHSFIPPTPGPIAVADILMADLGWVILFGFLVGIPTAIFCGPLFGKYIAKKIHVVAPKLEGNAQMIEKLPPVGSIIAIIAIPIVLIVLNTLLNSPLVSEESIPKEVLEWISMIGHPFSALIIANLIAWYLLGIRKGFTKKQLLDISKVEAGNLTPKLRNSNMVAFIENEVLLFKNAFDAKGVDLIVKNEEEEMSISFDPDMLSKVINNMLFNALKHTHHEC